MAAALPSVVQAFCVLSWAICLASAMMPSSPGAGGSVTGHWGAGWVGGTHAMAEAEGTATSAAEATSIRAMMERIMVFTRAAGRPGSGPVFAIKSVFAKC